MSPRGQGVCIGLGFGMIVMHAMLALAMLLEGLDHPAGYFDTLPLFWSPAWLVGVPVLGIAALVMLLIKKPPTGAGHLTVAAALVVTAVATWFFGYLA